jgi:PIN domain nuclease of toxin-antitoxin system
VRILLDTHVVIWWDEGKRLSREADRAIRTAEQVYVSAVSQWEIAIKTTLGRLKPRRTLEEAIEDSGFEELPVRVRHGVALSAVPLLHRDPFDRMLVAQATAEGLTLVTRDSVFDKYDVTVIEA